MGFWNGHNVQSLLAFRSHRPKIRCPRLHNRFIAIHQRLWAFNDVLGAHLLVCLALELATLPDYSMFSQALLGAFSKSFINAVMRSI